MIRSDDILVRAQVLALARGENGCSLAYLVADHKVIYFAAAKQRLRPMTDPQGIDGNVA